MTDLFLQEVRKLPGIRLIGRDDIQNRGAVISIQLHNIDISDAAFRLDNTYGIMTRVGLHCAPNAHKTLGTYPTGTIRFSFGHYNTAEEIFTAIEALHNITAHT